MFFKKVTIIGLGLIGGSLAWGLKKTGQIEEVTGVDIDEDTLEYAVNKNIVDNVSSDPSEAVRNTDLVVVATHVGLIPKVVNSLIANLSAKTTITDVGSIKEDIVKEKDIKSTDMDVKHQEQPEKAPVEEDKGKKADSQNLMGFSEDLMRKTQEKLKELTDKKIKEK